MNWKVETDTIKSGSNISKEPARKSNGKKNKKLTKKEMNIVKLTHSNIFDWLKPTKEPTYNDMIVKKQDMQVEQLLSLEKSGYVCFSDYHTGFTGRFNIYDLVLEKPFFKGNSLYIFLRKKEA